MDKALFMYSTYEDPKKINPTPTVEHSYGALKHNVDVFLRLYTISIFQFFFFSS